MFQVIGYKMITNQDSFIRVELETATTKAEAERMVKIWKEQTNPKTWTIQIHEATN